MYRFWSCSFIKQKNIPIPWRQSKFPTGVNKYKNKYLFYFVLCFFVPPIPIPGVSQSSLPGGTNIEHFFLVISMFI